MLRFSCPACGRRYDAAESEVGSTFACACGTTVTVPRIAEVKPKRKMVRCAYCGERVPEDKAVCRDIPASSMTTPVTRGGPPVFVTQFNRALVCEECDEYLDDCKRQWIRLITIFAIVIITILAAGFVLTVMMEIHR